MDDASSYYLDPFRNINLVCTIFSCNPFYLYFILALSEYLEPLKIESSHFIECITKKIKPLSDGLNGLQVVKALETAQRSLDNGGMSIDL